MDKKIEQKILRRKGLNDYDKRVLRYIIKNPNITKEKLSLTPIKVRNRNITIRNDYISQLYINWVRVCVWGIK